MLDYMTMNEDELIENEEKVNISINIPYWVIKMLMTNLDKVKQYYSIDTQRKPTIRQIIQAFIDVDYPDWFYDELVKDLY